jgi:hypothetical protein
MEKKSSLIACSVCGDTNCNWHYGAVVCEACKKFFVRSITEPDRKYTCAQQKECKINIMNRAACQYCRFQKCVEVGLDLNSKFELFNLEIFLHN